ncbi:hypothetical protein HOY80DRAFT_1138661 [Tuber brumale]|nr:hypothetical protein HOY80DRAFT_1138661 [Tuber brumale]
MVEKSKHPGKISVGWAEGDIIEKVAPEGVAVNTEKVQARVTAMTLAVEEAMPKEVYAVNEAPARGIRIQRHHEVLAISRPVLVLEVEPSFSACDSVFLYRNKGGAIGPTSVIPNPTENSPSKEPTPATLPCQRQREGDDI